MKKNAKKSYLHDLLTYPSGQARSTASKLPKQGIHITTFTPKEAHTSTLQLTEDSTLPLPADEAVTWYHLIGVSQADTLHRLLEPFMIHELVMEDILSTKQRPKIEDYGQYLFIATTVFGTDSKGMHNDQVYLILGKNFIITVQSKPLGLFTPIKNRLSEDYERVYSKGAAFLAYMLIDRVVDDYFVAMDAIAARNEKLDQKLFSTNNSDILPKIHRLKRDAVRIRRALIPMREGLTQMMRGDFALIPADIHVFVRDTYDHTLQLSESLDAIRDTVQSMMDVYLSFQSNALNKQMRVLTSITIIFMPLTLIAGIYGMNFDFMPELHWRYGYFAVLGLMAVLAVIMLKIFKKKDWL